MITIPARKVENQYYKKIGGELFVERENYVKKDDAEYVARTLRSGGLYKVRVIPGEKPMGKYGLWRIMVRGKDKSGYQDHIPSPTNPDPRKKKGKRK